MVLKWWIYLGVIWGDVLVIDEDSSEFSVPECTLDVKKSRKAKKATLDQTAIKQLDWNMSLWKADRHKDLHSVATWIGLLSHR